MDAKDKIFDQYSFNDEKLECPACGWMGTGSEAIIADFYGVGKFQQVSCPRCQEYLGNLSNNNSFAEDEKTRKDRS